MRSGRITWVAVGVLLACSAMADGASVQGNLKYSGQPVSATFTSMVSGVAQAYDNSSSQWINGTVNIQAGTYSFSNLPAGEHGIRVLLSPRGGVESTINSPGDLVAKFNVTVGSATIVRDADLKYSVRVTQPFDANLPWDGSAFVCPLGAATPSTFTLTWDPVPRAVGYRVWVGRWNCASYVATDIVETTATSLAIQHGQAAGEQSITVEVEARNESGAWITVSPYVTYAGGSSANAYLFKPGGTSSGRPTHPVNSRFIAQIAHAPGVAPTFWKSDLFLTNPTSSAVTATLTYTARGANGTSSYTTKQVIVPANASRAYTDVLDSLFRLSGAGSLEVSPASIEVASRCYTPGTGTGAYGQGFPAIAADQTIYSGGPSTRLGSGGVVKGTFRTNLTLVEVWGESARLRVRLLNRDGGLLGERNVDLHPFGNTQINDVVKELSQLASLAEGQVQVDLTSGSGRVAGCVTLVDNGTQDPTTFPLNRR